MKTLWRTKFYLTEEMKADIRETRNLADINERIREKDSVREIFRTATLLVCLLIC
jgi:hypothetical protein